MPRLPNNIKVSQDEVSQTFNLAEITGLDFSGESDIKGRIGQAIIDKIVSRSEGGKDIRGNTFEAYADSYKKSEEFEAFGKSNKVNMTLSGNMLSTLDILSSGGSKIKIGWNDSTNNAKSFNHMTGDTVKQRQFFGVQKKAVKEVLIEFRQEIDRMKRDQTQNGNVSNFLNRLSVSQDEDDGLGTTISVGDFFG